MKILRFFLLLLNIVAITCLLATYCTYFISPQTFWLFEFIALGYPLYLVLNIGFVAFWILTKKKKYAYISLIVIGIGYKSLFSFIGFGTSSSSTQDEISFTLVSYNVYAFNKKGWKFRSNIQHEVFLYLQQEQPDIICFQEFHHDTQEPFVLLDSITNNLGLNHMAMYHFHAIPGRYFYGNIICSKFQIVNHGVLEFQKRGNSCVWADVVIETDTVRIFNMHLESYRLTPHNISVLEDAVHTQGVEKKEYTTIKTKLSRAIQIRALQTQELVAFFKNTPYKIIVCGDFNAPPYSHTYQNIKNASHTKDAFVSAGFGVGGTLNWNLPSIRLDYILYPQQWKAKQYSSVKQDLSDHFPISAQISRN